MDGLYGIMQQAVLYDIMEKSAFTKSGTGGTYAGTCFALDHVPEEPCIPYLHGRLGLATRQDQEVLPPV